MRKLTILLLGASLLAIAGYVLYAQSPSSNIATAYIDSALLKSLPQRENAKIQVVKTAPTIIPPTNSWVAGAVFHEPAQPVYSYPNSIKLTSSGFELALPQVTTTDKVITGGHVNQLAVTVPGMDGYVLTYYDSFRATFSLRKNATELATLTITRGSPYVFLMPKTDLAVTASSAGPFDSAGIENYARTTIGSSSVAMSSRSASIRIEAQTAEITARRNNLMTFYTLPASVDDQLRELANNEVSGVSLQHVDRGSEIQTAYEYKTRNGQPTAFVTMPHQQVKSSKQPSIKYDTVYGTATLYTGHDISFSVERVAAKSQLPLSELSEGERAQLRTQLSADVQKTVFDATDTYFAGKQLYRAANLLQVAIDLDDETSAEILSTKLKTEFDLWFDPLGGDKRANKYFYYDTTIKGLVGQTASFGSDEFNDHHFHYGYFIYAASILAAYDKTFVEKHGDFVNLLTADIAATGPNKHFPVRRAYDPYSGHSWASGTAPFADGNNQESVSEAVNAWSAVALWSKQTNNKSMLSQANWMLSTEMAAMDAYWLDFDRSKTPYTGYGHTVVSLNWSGKRDYATFFSDAPSAKLGILLIPLNPTFAVLADQKERITINSKEALPGTTDVQFGDYITMYEALSPQNTNYTTRAQSISDNNIDSANSRTYMNAWLMAANKNK